MHKSGFLWLLPACLLLGATAPLPAAEEREGTVLKPAGEVEDIAVSRDGRWLVAGCKDETRLWDLKATDPSAGSLVLKGHANPVTFLAVSPDSRWLVTGASFVGRFDRAARLWDLKAADPTVVRAVLGGHGARVEQAVFGADARWLITRAGDKTARLWDLKPAGK
jgi:WD40 repeat protein